jgi:GIY-YIG catalytic domain
LALGVYVLLLSPLSQFEGRFPMGPLHQTHGYSNNVSLDFQNLLCNCRQKPCKYNNVCRHSLVVYKVECTNMGKVYIGNTQQHLKKRMSQHARDVRRKKEQNINSDTFTSHFADQMRLFPDFSHTLLKFMMTCSIIWQLSQSSLCTEIIWDSQLYFMQERKIGDC